MDNRLHLFPAHRGNNLYTKVFRGVIKQNESKTSRNTGRKLERKGGKKEKGRKEGERRKKKHERMRKGGRKKDGESKDNRMEG